MRKFLFVLFGVFMVFSAVATGENVPTSRSYVDSVVAPKQDTIEHATGAPMVLTNAGTAGEYGTKGIYDSTGEYATQQNNLVDAATMNAGVQNAINSEFQCIEWDEHGECLLLQLGGISEIAPGYTRVEYLESTGTQYIDTGIKQTPNIGFMVKYQFTQLQNQTYILGSYTPHYYLGITSNGYMAISYGSGTGNVRVSIPNGEFTTVPYTTKANYNNSHIAEFVGIKSAIMPEVTFSNNKKNMYLFGLNNVPYYLSKSRIYTLQITDGTELVRNFIPARRNGDGVLGMYDTVSNTFFTNAGTGEFIAGPIIYIPQTN